MHKLLLAAQAISPWNTDSITPTSSTWSNKEFVQHLQTKNKNPLHLEETNNLRKQVDKMRELVEKLQMANAAATQTCTNPTTQQPPQQAYNPNPQMQTSPYNQQLPFQYTTSPFAPFSTINPMDTAADAVAVAVVAVGVAEAAEATNVNASTVGRTDYAVTTEESATTRLKAIRLMQPLKIKWEAIQEMPHDGVG